MSKNQNLTSQNSQNQNNAMSDDDLGDGRRLSKNLRGEGGGPKMGKTGREQEEQAQSGGRFDPEAKG